MSSVEHSILDEIRRLNRNLENIAHELRTSNKYNAEAVRVSRDVCELNAEAVRVSRMYNDEAVRVSRYACELIKEKSDG